MKSTTTVPHQLGFSFSPGGLLLPYHLGVMDSLDLAGHLTERTPVAGASAGAIAVACHACGIPSAKVLDATVALVKECELAGGPRGRLIPALRRQMAQIIGQEEIERLQNRPGPVGIAYQELFPLRRSVVQTMFTSPDDLMDAVSFSSTFPFFSDRWPVAVDRRQSFPKLVVDGFFSVPRERFGCPDLSQITANATQQGETQKRVDEVLVACFPREKMGLTAVSADRCISPTENAFDDAVVFNSENKEEQSTFGIANFIQIAMEACPPSTYFDVYERGLADGEAWSLKLSESSWAPPAHTPLN